MFFFNPFAEEFRGNLVLGDRAQSLTFICPANAGRGTEWVTVYNESTLGTYNLSGNDANGTSHANLVFSYAYDPEHKSWGTLSVDVTNTATSAAAVSPAEIVTDLNADATFAQYFIAELKEGFRNGVKERIVIYVNPSSKIRPKFYIVPGAADEVLGFNRKMGVVDMPTYFLRHTINNVRNYEDGLGQILSAGQIVTSVTAASPAVVTVLADNLAVGHNIDNGDTIYIFNTDQAGTPDAITGDFVAASVNKTAGTLALTTTDHSGGTAAARGILMTALDYNTVGSLLDAKGNSLGLSAANVKDDWDLLEGRSGLFNFQNITVDGSDRITEIIEMHAGAVAGDLVRKIHYSYTSTNTKPSTITELPYTLRAADIPTPPAG